jgi:hypothetical protein
VIHGQSGVAPNGIELHPVLKFASAELQALGGSAPPRLTSSGAALAE